MPWKIKTLTHNADASRLHLHDPKADVHLVTHMKTGVVDLFIGADHPANARVWVSFDATRSNMVQVERMYAVTPHHMTVIIGILGTMELDPLPVAIQLRREIARSKTQRQAAWSEYVVVVDEPHHGQIAAE